MKSLLANSFVVLTLCLFLSSSAQASTVNAHNWNNEASGVKAIQIWITNPDVSIKSIKINKKSIDGWSWSYDVDSQSSIIFSGPETIKGGDFMTDIQFTAPSVKTDFSVEWAEIAGDDILTGTNFYENKKWSFSQGEIGNTPTPLPGALILMGGGLSMLVFVRRKFSKN